MKKINFLALLAISIFLFSCTSTQTGDSGGTVSGLSPRTRQLVEDAVFEVIVKKAQNDPAVYEKELDWELVPYAIRTDDYYSIGTAFAISQTELITAFHVMNLVHSSMVYDRYFVRDSQGRVYEVDQVIAGSNERDFLIFTAKGLSVNNYFQLERKFKIGDTVLSIGNALGEGIVVRNGLILGTVPEEESGRWNQLKSSADGNPGNSGGPLVTPDGRMVGLAVGLKDNNILYSVPVSVIFDFPRSQLNYRTKFSYGHLILANTLINVLETQVPLPGDYLAVNRQLAAAYDKNYEARMEELFVEAPAYLEGPNNAYLLNSAVSSDFPELDFVNPNDNNWYLSDLEVKSQQLPDNGLLIQASISGFDLFKIRKPKPVSLQISADPRYVMDQILQNINTERVLGNQKYRILSYGDPGSVTEYRDAQGRLWVEAHWVIGFEDKVLLMYILPLPDGSVVLMSKQDSNHLKVYQWDMRKTCDHIHAAYVADFDQWNDFIAVKKYIPGFLKDFTFSWQQETRSIAFSYPGLSFQAGSDVFDWNSSSKLFLGPAYYTQENAIELGIQRIVVQRDLRGREYALFYKNIKPDARLGTKAAENWNDLIQEKYPFDGNPGISAKDNAGSVGIIIPARRPNPDIRYSLYLSMENPQGEDNLKSRIKALQNGIQVER
jgi:hypothetical protein